VHIHKGTNYRGTTLILLQNAEALIAACNGACRQPLLMKIRGCCSKGNFGNALLPASHLRGLSENKGYYLLSFFIAL